MALLPRPSIEGYREDLREFAALHRDKLQAIYRDYGTYSDWAHESAYWLFTQPESIMAFQLVETAPVALASAVSGTEIERVVEKLYSHGAGRCQLRSTSQ